MPPDQSDEPRSLRAVILDWAGTAVDYGSLAPRLAFEGVFRRRGISLGQEEVRAPMGMDKRDHIRAILQMASVQERWLERYGKPPDESDAESVYQEFIPVQLELLASHARPIPGTLEAVAAMRRMGLKIGSTTGYNREMMEVLAPAAAEYGYQPDAVVCVSDISPFLGDVPPHFGGIFSSPGGSPGGRPAPWMALLCAMQLRAYPMAAIVKIGDTALDIAEGLNAGMWTIGVALTGNEIGLDEAGVKALPANELSSRLSRAYARLHQAGAHYVVDGIWDVPAVLEEINGRLRSGEGI
jgi:phosphonoacetaldehyde hydrolase